MVTWRTTGKGQTEAFEQLFKDSDRSTAVVAASFVEHFLEDMLKRFFRGDDKPALSSIFQGTGSLTTFSAKIQLGYLLRLFGRRAARELHTIRGIRNEFAHKIEVLQFSTNSVADRCRNLTLVDGYHLDMSEYHRLFEVPGMHFYESKEKAREYLTDPRTRYLETCGIFVSTFGYSNGPIFPQIHGDDRPGWPIHTWHTSPLR